ncbi:MAG TPA: IS3 family transposase [Chloroflexota bacterium]|nr:IS3 family transposase [Chloroflexota bacterium]
MNSYRFIASVESDHPVALSCTVLKVARSGFYAWRRRERLGLPCARTRADVTLTERITVIHRESAGTYGSPRVHAELLAQQVHCARKRVERLMRQTGLHGCRRPVRRVRTTVADPATAPATDLVQRAFAPAVIGAPNRLWVADLTYVATTEGWLYLAAVLDAFSRRVVGWSMADHLRTDLVLDALTMALQRRQPRAGLIHHSDHGCQYTAVAFGAQLQAAGLVASMGSVGDCFDNAVAESFFATLKVELLYREEWLTRAAAKSAIFRFIETWYNTRRRHSTLDYLSPAAFEEVQQQNAVA